MWYNVCMTAKLNKELSDALHASDGDRLPIIIDPTSNRLYVLVDAEAFEELECQQTRQAIQAGLDSMKAGGGIPLEEADTQMRKELGFPARE